MFLCSLSVFTVAKSSLSAAAHHVCTLFSCFVARTKSGQLSTLCNDSSKLCVAHIHMNLKWPVKVGKSKHNFVACCLFCSFKSKLLSLPPFPRGSLAGEFGQVSQQNICCVTASSIIPGCKPKCQQDKHVCKCLPTHFFQCADSDSGLQMSAEAHC